MLVLTPGGCVLRDTGCSDEVVYSEYCPSYRLLPAPVKLKVPVLEPRMETLQTETYGLLSAALAEFHLQQL